MIQLEKRKIVPPNKMIEGNWYGWRSCILRDHKESLRYIKFSGLGNYNNYIKYSELVNSNKTHFVIEGACEGSDFIEITEEEVMLFLGKNLQTKLELKEEQNEKHFNLF